jgi:hypothetical protein
MNRPDPQPISLEDAQRIWTLQQQNKPLSAADRKLIEQAAEWQMWTSHGIKLQSERIAAERSSQRSKSGRQAAAAC